MEPGGARALPLPHSFHSPFRAPQLSGIFILDSTESWARKGMWGVYGVKRRKGARAHLSPYGTLKGN